MGLSITPNRWKISVASASVGVEQSVCHKHGVVYVEARCEIEVFVSRHVVEILLASLAVLHRVCEIGT